jgi:hypothetical protein
MNEIKETKMSTKEGRTGVGVKVLDWFFLSVHQSIECESDALMDD